MKFTKISVQNIGIWLLSLLFTSISAQENFELDTIQPITLQETIVFSRAGTPHLKEKKPLANIDEYLENSSSLHLIKRGAYAWEPSINSMSTERINITIDGMQIFGACTDKMDPVTSYVDVSNLAQAEIFSGQQGNEFGHGIGGALNLKTESNKFVKRGLTLMGQTGYETNNNMYILVADANYNQKNFYIDSDISFRKADNFFAGNKKEVLFSSFQKLNASLNTGFRIDSLQSIHTSFIFDQANDVGYPALTMDVSLARAIIGSVAYEHSDLGNNWKNWQTKIYANQIEHVMDDTTRPDVAIHMDMPGWSTTAGYYSKIEHQKENNQLKINISGHWNRSIAEMTMYPQNPTESPMFMFTWPDVHTLYNGIFAENQFKIGSWDAHVQGRIGVNQNRIENASGLSSLQIFYPEMEKNRTRFLKSFGSGIYKHFHPFEMHFTVGYAERAPSVSEAYGFYLFNSFDKYDYIGNPDLSNEKSLETTLSMGWMSDTHKISIEGNFFHIQDYIIGEISPNLSNMTLDASGVKIYQALDFAQIWNIKLISSFQFNPNLSWNGRIGYYKGTSDSGENLPLISPINIQSGLHWQHSSWMAMAEWDFAAKQKNYSASYGEDATAAYHLFHISAGKEFKIDSKKIYIRTGIQNLFDAHYSTFSDWNNIPRPGRNFFFHLSFIL
ncbi:MAG: TonB-dependent receptor [Flavobacteriaceae bacterium]|nr:TonB-dependent receptor [Flavobacteriaceae bacterium]